MADRLTFDMSDEVTRAFPGHATGLVRVVSDAPVRPKDGATADLAARYRADPGPATRSSEHWAETYRAMGAKPKYASSLLRLQGMERDVGAITVPVKLVELYCWYSLVAGTPMAGYRTDAIVGNLRLTMPGAGVPFTALGQRNGSQEKTKPREVAYIDDDKAICRYWNYRDCDQTKLSDGLTDVLFVFDLHGDAVGRFDDIAEGLISSLEPACCTIRLSSATVEV